MPANVSSVRCTWSRTGTGTSGVLRSARMSIRTPSLREARDEPPLARDDGLPPSFAVTGNAPHEPSPSIDEPLERLKYQTRRLVALLRLTSTNGSSRGMARRCNARAESVALLHAAEVSLGSNIRSNAWRASGTRSVQKRQAPLGAALRMHPANVTRSPDTAPDSACMATMVDVGCIHRLTRSFLS